MDVHEGAEFGVVVDEHPDGGFDCVQGNREHACHGFHVAVCMLRLMCERRYVSFEDG